MGDTCSKMCGKPPGREEHQLQARHHGQSGTDAKRTNTAAAPKSSRRQDEAPPDSRRGKGPAREATPPQAPESKAGKPPRPVRSGETDNFIVAAKQSTGGARKQKGGPPPQSRAYEQPEQDSISQADDITPVGRVRQPRAETKVSYRGEIRDRAEAPKTSSVPVAPSLAVPLAADASDSSSLTPIDEDPMDELDPRSKKETRQGNPYALKGTSVPPSSYGSRVPVSTAPTTSSHHSRTPNVPTTPISHYFPPGSLPHFSTGAAYESEGESCAGSENSDQGNQPQLRRHAGTR